MEFSAMKFTDKWGNVHIISGEDWRDLGCPMHFTEYEEAFTNRKKRENAVP